MNNRRNYYRILHVQPEAPLEIIKASYRSLMTKLKAHPDLGGDHETAVLINQAYVVLSDPNKRRQYDQMLQTRKYSQSGRATQHRGNDSAEPSVKTNASNVKSNPKSQQARTAGSHQKCVFCGTATFLAPKSPKHCSACSSPLEPARTAANGRLREIFGRRTAPRVAKAGALMIYPQWPHNGFAARLRDLSPSGISMLTHYGARAGQILKLDSAHLKGIAHVVSVKPNGAHFSVHASLLTAEFVSKSGTFVAERA
jgi:predicted nucleic acid-binding Zn ribbon protein